MLLFGLWVLHVPIEVLTHWCILLSLRCGCFEQPDEFGFLPRGPEHVDLLEWLILFAKRPPPSLAQTLPHDHSVVGLCDDRAVGCGGGHYDDLIRHVENVDEVHVDVHFDLEAEQSFINLQFRCRYDQLPTFGP
jgi:hypothetical protein